MGIDYGMGTTNIDLETGIRFGVIHSNKLSPYAAEDIYTHGDDLSYAEWKEDVVSNIHRAIRDAVENYGSTHRDLCEIADEVFDSLELEYESVDGSHYSYEDDDCKLELHRDGDIFVLKSKFYTLCDFCSPCAPGAGYLTDEGNVKSYCLPPDWFDEHNPMPYKCYRVDDDSEVVQNTSKERGRQC